MAAEVVLLMTESTAKEKKEWMRIKKIILRLLVLAGLVCIPEIPDSNGNTFLGHFLTGSVASLYEAQLQESARIVIEQVQHITGKSTNPFYLPLQDIIRQAITTYQSTHKEDPAFWQREENYASDYRAAMILVGSGKMRGLVDTKYRQELFTYALDELPDSMRLAYELPPVVAGTKLYRENAAEAQIVNYYDMVKSDLERLYLEQETHHPLSQVQVLEYFLDRCQGNIAEAIADMTGFFKYMIRGVAPIYDTGNTEWMRVYIQDQMNDAFFLNAFPDAQTRTHEEDSLMRNLYGGMYHILAVASLSASQSSGVILVGTLQNYANIDSDIARYKELKDLQVVYTLNDTMAMLQRDYAKIGS